MAGVDDEPLKLVSPAYVAVSVRAPAVVNVIEHVPVATVPTQLSPVLALTVTLPVGFAALGITSPTVKVIGTA